MADRHPECNCKPRGVIYTHHLVFIPIWVACLLLMAYAIGAES